jgi:leucyl-tRNA---protein transferase
VPLLLPRLSPATIAKPAMTLLICSGPTSSFRFWSLSYPPPPREAAIMDSKEGISALGLVDALLDGFGLPSTDNGNCPYLPDRLVTTESFQVDTTMSATVYHALMDRGFRRSGRVFYRPVCRTCRLCIPIRIPAATFQPSRSMRRVWRKNADLCFKVGDGIPTAAKHGLFARYLAGQHDYAMAGDFDSFRRFLYNTPLPGAEFCYYAGSRLVGVGLADICPTAVSSVYMYFDPTESRRSLGTYSILREIEHCRSLDIPYYYLGFYVPGSKTMAYKARFRPAEILDPTGRWVPLEITARAG